MSVHQAQLVDQTMNREIPEQEWQDAGQRPTARTWQELTDEEITSWDAVLSHFYQEPFVSGSCEKIEARKS
jgi:hypothetical protein